MVDISQHNAFQALVPKPLELQTLQLSSDTNLNYDDLVKQVPNNNGGVIFVTFTIFYPGDNNIKAKDLYNRKTVQGIVLPMDEETNEQSSEVQEEISEKTPEMGLRTSNRQGQSKPMVYSNDMHNQAQNAMTKFLYFKNLLFDLLISNPDLPDLFHRFRRSLIIGEQIKTAIDNIKRIESTRKALQALQAFENEFNIKLELLSKAENPIEIEQRGAILLQTMDELFTTEPSDKTKDILERVAQKIEQHFSFLIPFIDIYLKRFLTTTGIEGQDAILELLYLRDYIEKMNEIMEIYGDIHKFDDWKRSTKLSFLDTYLLKFRKNLKHLIDPERIPKNRPNHYFWWDLRSNETDSENDCDSLSE